ncbi:Ig-like domain-containing protein [Bacillus sp. RG28]|uniref:Ig-like domain-containing protein n=1 Tax=Gottfriedia endophytica TaxID=2820819 RepID=A0A940NQM6_9BACI|nr:Ig-like domain-containing protein [Gottfriedia endophytica]MBP0725152.1 Ig-like domain-containing protein [Gottfriedia endophytica]
MGRNYRFNFSIIICFILFSNVFILPFKPIHTYASKQVNYLKIKEKDLILEAGKSKVLHVETNLIKPQISWVSSDANIVTVDSKGVITAKRAGNASISANIKNYNLSTKISVRVKSSDVEINSIVPDNNSISLYSGESTKINVTTFPMNATDKSLIWTSANKDVLEVDQQGVVYAKNPGTTSVIITSKSKKVISSVTITVSKKEETIPVTMLELSNKEITMESGKTIKANLTIYPTNATDKSIIWSSSDERVAIVDQDGNITTKQDGVSNIVASTKDHLISTYLTVYVRTNIVASDIELEKSNYDIELNRKLQIVAKVLPTNATNKKIIWKSLNPSIVTVDQEGTITGLQVGQASITASTEDGKIIKSININVKSVQLTPQEIYKLVNSSIVYVETYDVNNRLTASGSGFITSSNGTVVTNYHVIYSQESPVKYVKVKLPNGNIYTVTRVIDYDKEKDLAVLQIDGVNNLPPIKLGNSDLIEVGDSVVAIGSPLGLENSLSIGIISSKQRLVDGNNYIQTTTPISHGSSGGALINLKGEVIGVTSAGFTNGQNLNLAIPINNFKKMSLDKNTDISTLNNISGNIGGILKGNQDLVEREPNDDLTNAQLISYSNFSIIGNIYKYYDLDFYKFTISSSQSFRMLGAFKDSYLTHDLVIGLRDSNGKIVAVSKDYYSSNGIYQSISANLTAGTYYLVVLQGGSSLYYSLYNQPRTYFIAGILE